MIHRQVSHHIARIHAKAGLRRNACKRRAIFIPLLLVLSGVAGPAGAMWKIGDSYEPDTAYDESGGMMWMTPDTDPNNAVRRVYFNVITFTAPVAINPNSGVLKSQVEPAGSQGWTAYLGVWKDCNKDGYVGAAASGSFEYRAELLLDPTICPASANARQHNDGEWVHEFLWVGQTDIVPDADGDGDTTKERDELARRVIHDDEARVWGDRGAPGGPADDACPIRPWVGTTSSTGALLAYADCWDHRRVAALVNQLDEAASLGLGFEDKRKPYESDSPLNQDVPVGLWGNPYGSDGNQDHQRGVLEDGRRNGGADERPAFTVYDCDGTISGDTSGLAQGSYYDAVNSTIHSVQGDCYRSDTPAYAGLEPERGAPRVGDGRSETDMVFSFQTRVANSPSPATSLLGIDTPPDLGVSALRAWQGSSTGWVGHTRQLPHAPGMRDDLQPTGASYSTFYAHLGTASLGDSFLQIPSPIPSFYGAESCLTGAALDNGVNCNPDSWWIDSRGESTMPTQTYFSATNGQVEMRTREMGARIGDLYQLRDVDCYDGEVIRGTDVYASPQAFTETPNCRDSSVGLLSEYYDLVPQLDDNRNGLGDEFERQSGLTQEQIRAALEQFLDFDEDGATLLEEFQWDTIPIATPGVENSRDWDDDDWLDGDEIDYWNTPAAAPEMPGLAFRDPDSYDDVDGDQRVNQHDNDSDNDGWLDGWEIGLTYPEFADSDCEPSARACTRSGQSHYRATDRVGNPGTGDGIADGAEYEYWGDRATGDCDNDSIPNVLDADSDQDGILDGPEIALGFDPCVDDEDEDGLKDGQELAHGTDPRNPDTDGDGMPDGWEVDHQLDPLDEADARQDGIDQDGLLNLEEYLYGADPRVADTDFDTLDDRREVRELRTNPASWDSDGDQMPDGWEVQHGLRPTDPSDAYEDPDHDVGDIDGDGVPEYVHTNLREYRHLRPSNWDERVAGAWNGTNPRHADTDKDNKTDGYEIATGDEPKVATPSLDQDADRDGLLLSDELDRGTGPTDPDSDADGLCDGGAGPACIHPCTQRSGSPGEVNNYGSNPLLTDSDADGLTDTQEVCLFDPTGSGSTHDFDGDLADSIVDPDSDGDRLSDLAEYPEGGSEPHLADTDADGLDDYQELVMSHLNGHPTLVDNADTDGDLLLDGEEVALGTWPDIADTDEDGLTDFEEVNAYGTSPFLPDTDFDRMPDWWEVANHLNPFVNDANEDPDHDGKLFGLTNYQEYALGLNGGTSTDPHNADTDGDLLDDYWEVAFGMSPTEPASITADSDDDGLTDLNEFLLGTDPNHHDTDADGLTDWKEVGTNQMARILSGSYPSNPTLRDSDDDGLSDAREKILWDELGATMWLVDHDMDSGQMLGALGTSSNLNDSDSDNDGLDDGQEFLVFHTHPAKADTDGDGATDWQEIMVFFTNPHDPASNAQHRAMTAAADRDGDGLSDADEAHYGTNPGETDTDRDGISDGAEFAAWGPRVKFNFDDDEHANNLLDPDSDNDGILDGIEFIASGLPRAQFYITDPGSPDTDTDGLMDGEEAGNGLTLPSTDGAIVVRGSFRGSFGLPLVRASSTPTSEPGRNGPSNEPAPDDDDADNDGLLDGRELAIGSNPRDPDTDKDGLPDFLEPVGRSTVSSRSACDYPIAYDTDQDCVPDILDPDDDDDGIPDGEEAPDGNRQHGPSDPKDADTDDDGICDQREDAYRTGRRDADSDDDGLSDGLEVRSGRCTTTYRTDWTLESTPLAPWRTTYQPYLGIRPPLDPNTPEDIDTDGVTPPLDPDTDGDNMIDGLEDWNANGIVDPGEGNPHLQDGDGDGIPDSIELQVFGKMTYTTFLKEIAKRGLTTPNQAKTAATYDPLSTLKTNPTTAHTDTDGIPDGADLNPNGLNPPQISIKLDKIGMSDKIDCDWGCNYRLDPYFLFEITSGLTTVKPETLNLAELPIGGPSELIDISGIPLKLAQSANDASKTSRFTPGVLDVILSDDIALLPVTPNQAGDAEWDKVTIRVTMGDWDCNRAWDGNCLADTTNTRGRNPSDRVDISPQESDREPDYELTFKLSQFAAQLKAENYSFFPAEIPSGNRDGHGNWFGQEDDGTLMFHIENLMKADFLDRANTLRTPTGKIPAPTGQEFGI